MQIAIRQRLTFLGVLCIHVPNGGSRHVAEARRLRAQGVVAGVPDLICIHRDGRVAWLEVKRPGYTPSEVKPAQHDMHATLRERGQTVAIVTSQDEAVEALRAAGWWQ